MRKIQSSTTTLSPPNYQNQHSYCRVSCMDGTTGSECFSSNSSFSNETYSSDGSSAFANWEEHVGADGKLFYMEFMVHAKKCTTYHDSKRVEFSRSSSLRLGKKKNTSKIKAKNITPTRRLQQQVHGKQYKHIQQIQENQQLIQNESAELVHKFTSIKPHDISAAKKLELVITAADRYRFGRRSTAVESILGFRVAPFDDQPECLMVVDFVHDMPTLQVGQQIPVQRGDWFQSLDDIDIRASNVNELLLQFHEPTKVCLKFQGPSGDATAANIATVDNKGDSTNTNSTNQLHTLENFSQFTQAFKELLCKDDQPTQSTMINSSSITSVSHDEIPILTVKPSSITKLTNNNVIPFALLILPPECCQLEENKNSLYFYPEDGTNNFLYKTRGSFLTLNAVFGAELNTLPLSSSLSFDGEPYSVHYRRLENFLVLFAYAKCYSTVEESTLRCDELIADMRFSFSKLTLDNIRNNIVDGTMDTVPREKCHSTADENVSLLKTFLRDFCEVQRVRVLLNHSRYGVLFEELLRESRLLSLPKEAQLRIFDALSEMEAMDYRNWNDEPLHTHREFFIYGSALYCGHHLLVTQMPVEARAIVEGFIRCRGIFDFISEHTVKSLTVWQEIFIDPSVNAAGQNDRFFLSICARSHLLLAVILKMFNDPDLTESSIVPPSLFYIEEIQETLDHLIQCGIESLAMFWTVSNKRPEVWHQFDALSEVEEAKCIKEGGNNGHRDPSSRLEAFIKQRLYTNNTVNGTTCSSSLSFEEDAHLCSSLGSLSMYSLTPSEEESNRQQIPNSSDTGVCNSDSDSDWEHFGDQHHDSKANVAPVTMSESLYKEINNVLPTSITPGWRNSLYYYISIDLANGTIFCPLKTDNFQWLREMRSALYIIRGVFLRAKSTRRHNLSHDKDANDVSPKANSDGRYSNNFYKNELSIIKEYSTTIRVRSPADGSMVACFNVSGRLFTAKEVYICHHPEIPLNMVEMAFRLSYFAAG